jgi:hypothetical protein
LEEFYQEHPTALIYLDMAHIPNRLSILTDSGANIAPIWLVESTLSRLDEMNLGFLVQGNRPQLFRFNIPGRENILKGYFDANIPALAYQSAEGPLPSSEHKEWASQFLGYLKGTIDGNPSGLPEFWDHHYLFFQIQNQYIILNQGTYILLLLALFALVMILAVSFPKNLTNAGLIIWKHLWQLPVGLIFIFLFLLGATLMLEGIFLLREFSDLWEYAPITFFTFKILITLFLFFTTFYLVKRMPLNRWAVFYAYSSILVMGLGFLIALLLGLSLSFYFLWSLLLASAANLLPQRWLKLLAILGAPFWLIKGLIDIFSAQELVLIQNILLDPLAGNFILAFLIFPFLLLFSSFHFIRHQKPERNDRFRAILISLVIGLVTLGTGLYLLFFVPFGAEQKQPILIRDTWRKESPSIELTEGFTTEALEHTLEVISPVPMLNINLRVGSTSYSISDGSRRWSRIRQAENPPVIWEKNYSDFLNRRTWNLKARSTAPLEQLKITLTSETPFILFDSQFPSEISKDGLSAELFIGYLPPQELDISFTIAQDVELLMEWEYTGSNLPEEIQLSPDNLGPEVRIKISGSFILESIYSEGRL